jgi:micrococcal nuclease
MPKIIYTIIGFFAFLALFSIGLPEQEIIKEVRNNTVVKVKEVATTTNESIATSKKVIATSTELIIVEPKVELPPVTPKIEVAQPEKEITTPIIESEPQYKYYYVLKVVDGDTIKINIDGKTETIRLIGMDTPETVDPRKPVQCFGKEASDKGKELLSGQKVRIETDPTQGDRDRYNRLLAYVYRDDGLFYNKYMIENGYAYEYTYNTPYEYQTEFKKAQDYAMNNNLGLWSPNTCNGETESVTSTKTKSAIEQPVGKFYTSSYRTSKYYYPESCNEWQNLSTKYLKSFNSLDELLAKYPSKTKNPNCE